MVVKMSDKMASLWFELDFNGSFRLAIVDFGLSLVGNGVKPRVLGNDEIATI